MGGDVRRVPTRVIRDLCSEPRDQDDVEGSHPWASMRSDHFGSSVAAALALAEADLRLGAAAAAYAAALGFALVYLGEHYVTDLAAGLGLAAGVQVIERALTTSIRRRRTGLGRRGGVSSRVGPATRAGRRPTRRARTLRGLAATPPIGSRRRRSPRRCRLARSRASLR
jgi:PAP2 superfamily